MSRITLFDNEYITVEYHTDLGLIYHAIHQPMGVEQNDMLKEALNAGTEAMAKYGLCKWLSDDRKNGPLPDEMVEWGNTDWNPRTINAGWKYWANVVPEEVHAAGSMVPVIDNLYALGLRMMVFTSVERAIAWLNEMK